MSASREDTLTRIPINRHGEQIEAVRIPAGVFLMGKEKAEVELPEFVIARFPTTNQQYAEFVRDCGHRTPKWPSSGYPEELADHPVVNVSYEDAQAFADWLGARLPTEAEWEKAARGTDGRLYPWGNEFEPSRCNTSEAGSDGTRPVTAHPQGASPYGVVDLSGNVWEWTSTLFEPDQEWRVLKGGAWDYKGFKDARCSARVYFSPGFRNNAIGFRCCWDA